MPSGFVILDTLFPFRYDYLNFIKGEIPHVYKDLA